MKEITLKLTMQELQTVFQSLSNLPYVQVHELIGKVQLQATPQLQRMNGKAAGASSEEESEKAEKA